jgi:hypothetical protein
VLYFIQDVARKEFPSQVGLKKKNKKIRISKVIDLNMILVSFFFF